MHMNRIVLVTIEEKAEPIDFADFRRSNNPFGKTKYIILMFLVQPHGTA